MDKNIQAVLNKLPVTVKDYFLNNADKNITEIRIRAGFDIKLCVDGVFVTIVNSIFNEKQLQDLLYYFCDYTLSAYENQLAKGFITLNGGHRVGISGYYLKNIHNKNIIQKVTSMNIRIATSQRWNIPDNILNFQRGLLIAGGPHSGKTTFIRSLCNNLEDKNIVICDERNELYSGDINRDFIINMPKADAIEQAVRTMNPDVIVCDEIGNINETEAILSAVNNGAAFICSVHTYDLKSLYNKPNIALLLNVSVFDKIVFIENVKGNFIIKELLDV